VNAIHELRRLGFATVAGAVDATQRAALLRALPLERLQHASKHPSGVVFAARHLLTSLPELRAQLAGAGLDALASAFLGPGAFPIDAAYFDKQAIANWAVPAHQDRVFPVAPDAKCRQRVRDGVRVAEPSDNTLSQLLALRIHFDATGEEAGALFVLPGSHAAGVLSADEVKAAPLNAFVPCLAGAGDVLLMRPLLLHRSPSSRGAGQRRVLHVVYAVAEPDDGSRWWAARAHLGATRCGAIDA